MYGLPPPLGVTSTAPSLPVSRCIVGDAVSWSVVCDPNVNGADSVPVLALSSEQSKNSPESFPLFAVPGETAASGRLITSASGPHPDTSDCGPTPDTSRA